MRSGEWEVGMLFSQKEVIQIIRKEHINETFNGHVEVQGAL